MHKGIKITKQTHANTKHMFEDASRFYVSTWEQQLVLKPILKAFHFLLLSA